MKKLRVILLPVIWIAASAIKTILIIGFIMLAAGAHISDLLPSEEWIFEGWKSERGINTSRQW